MDTRRGFLKTVMAGSAAALTLRAWADRMAWPGPIGLQLLTIAPLLRRDPLGGLKDAAAIGYREVELSMQVHIPSEDLRRYLKQADLRAVSGHFHLTENVGQWQAHMETAKRLGLRYMVVDFGKTLDREGWKRFAGRLNKLGRVCAAEQIQFAYHNHFREFAPLGSTNGYRILLAHTDPRLVVMEMDIFWITYGQQDPVKYFREFPGRFRMLHLKGMKKGLCSRHGPFRTSPPPRNTIPFTEVGRGCIDWARIFGHVEEAGTKHVFVEQDRSDNPPVETMRLSYDYIRHLRIS